MFKDKDQLIHELAMKYASKTLDFENKSPEDLFKTYQDAYSEISKAYDTQEKENAELFYSPTIGVQTY